MGTPTPGLGVHGRRAGVPGPLSAIRFEGVGKRFPGVVALDNVTLEVRAGSCHALCGENGAGKSTLGKILAGIYAPDSGQVVLRDGPVRFGGPRDALAAGIGMVHQELAFCDNLSVAENLCLGRLPSRRGLVASAEMHAQARAMLDAVGLELDVTQPVSGLSLAQQQLLQIAQAVGSGASIIIFDEPTSSLSQPEAERLFDLIGTLAARGVTCLYVSHRMPEVFRLCDTVSVLRDGRHIATRPTAELSTGDLVRLMIGRPLAEYFPRHAAETPGDVRLRVEGLTRTGKFEEVTFELRAGEVVGLAGLVGAGRSEIAATLFGLPPPDRGNIQVRGMPVTIRSPRDAIAHGLGLVPEDRKRQGIVAGETGLHNVSLPVLQRYASASWIRRGAERRVAEQFAGKLSLRSGALDARVAGLSGGNQQKVVLARWLAAQSDILLLDEPTRGVDVGAKAEIHALVSDLARAGSAVLLISSELPELLSLSDRILVLREGRLVGELARSEASQDRLLRMMAGLA